MGDIELGYLETLAIPNTLSILLAKINFRKYG